MKKAYHKPSFTPLGSLRSVTKQILSGDGHDDVCQFVVRG
jgi:hypothetical protein